MSETFTTGPETFPVKSAVVKNRLVQVTDGGIEYADASSDVYGAVLADGAPKQAEPTTNSLVHTPHILAVYSAPDTVRLEVDGTASEIKRGAKIYASSEGKAKSSGTNVVGVAVADGIGNSVLVKLITPVVTAG